VGLAAQPTYEAAATVIGGDLDPAQRCQALVWLFSYLLGSELGNLVFLTGEHQSAEIMANRAMAFGVSEYAELLEQHVDDEDVGRACKVLRDLARDIQSRDIGRARRRLQGDDKGVDP
jgi:hypothetical protein